MFSPVLSLGGITVQSATLQVLFGGLCFPHVLLISHWKHRIDRAQNELNLSQKSYNRTALLKILL
ncbi:MAG: hypothetical protein CMI18_01100 [Opitutaceae bacterium]|nr:hypothetical protein [Opitutaceae bacterium]